MEDEKCEIEVANLPFLDGCPDAEELFLVQNAVGGAGEGGYALRRWADLAECIERPYLPRFHQELTEGDELSKVITAQAGYSIVDDSVSVVLDGIELMRYTDETALLEYIMYTVTYNGQTALISFFNAGSPLPDGRLIIIKYGIRRNL